MNDRQAARTTVRQYEPHDEQRLRVIAMQNYVDQLQTGQSTDVEDPSALAYLEHIIRMQENGKGIILLAEQGDQLIGFACLAGPAPAPEDNGQQDAYAFMSDLFVIPVQRNRGTGSLLVREIERQAHAMGAGHVALRVAVENSVSRHFYGKNRYHEKFVVLSKEITEE